MWCVPVLGYLIHSSIDTTFCFKVLICSINSLRRFNYPFIKQQKLDVTKLKTNCNEQFLFSHSVVYLFGELPSTFIKFEIVVWKLFQFGRV